MNGFYDYFIYFLWLDWISLISLYTCFSVHLHVSLGFAVNIDIFGLRMDQMGHRERRGRGQGWKRQDLDDHPVLSAEKEWQVHFFGLQQGQWSWD